MDVEEGIRGINGNGKNTTKINKKENMEGSFLAAHRQKIGNVYELLLLFF